MKKLMLLCLAIFGMVSIGVAQTVPTETTTDATINKNGANIEFETETIDYGTIENGSDGNREFKFTNTGTAPLVITSAKGSCGCTVPTWPHEAIAPGESSVIKVHYATERTGTFSKSVTLITNAVNAPTKVLHVKGTVNPKPTTK